MMNNEIEDIIKKQKIEAAMAKAGKGIIRVTTNFLIIPAILYFFDWLFFNNALTYAQAIVLIIVTDTINWVTTSKWRNK